MAFVEAMVIEVSRATVAGPADRQEPFPRFTYGEAIERFGSDKPDVRFGMELVDLAPALGAAAPGFRVFDEALGRRRAGQGDRRAGHGAARRGARSTS